MTNFSLKSVSPQNVLFDFMSFTMILHSKCGKLVIFLSPRFYVKSILRILEVQTELAILTHLKTLNFCITQRKIQSPWNYKSGIFEPSHPQKLISRKIWLIENAELSTLWRKTDLRLLQITWIYWVFMFWASGLSLSILLTPMMRVNSLEISWKRQFTFCTMWKLRFC